MSAPSSAPPEVLKVGAEVKVCSGKYQGEIGVVTKLTSKVVTLRLKSANGVTVKIQRAPLIPRDRSGSGAIAALKRGISGYI